MTGDASRRFGDVPDASWRDAVPSAERNCSGTPAGKFAPERFQRSSHGVESRWGAGARLREGRKGQKTVCLWAAGALWQGFSRPLPGRVVWWDEIRWFPASALRGLRSPTGDGLPCLRHAEVASAFGLLGLSQQATTDASMG